MKTITLKKLGKELEKEYNTIIRIVGIGDRRRFEVYNRIKGKALYFENREEIARYFGYILEN